MAYLSNEPGTQLTIEEQLALADLADLGLPLQYLRVDIAGTALEYATLVIPPGIAGEFLEAGQYDPFAVGGILISSKYQV